MSYRCHICGAEIIAGYGSQHVHRAPTRAPAPAASQAPEPKPQAQAARAARSSRAGEAAAGRDPWAPYCTRCGISGSLHHKPNIYTGRRDALGHPYPEACDELILPLARFPEAGEAPPCTATMGPDADDPHVYRCDRNAPHRHLHSTGPKGEEIAWWCSCPECEAGAPGNEEGEKP
jgi:hypothetical protein